jgi:hypothetical protein
MNKTIIYCTSAQYVLVASFGTMNCYRCATCGQEFTQSITTTGTFPTPHLVVATVSQLMQPTLAGNYEKPVTP